MPRSSSRIRAAGGAVGFSIWPAALKGGPSASISTGYAPSWNDCFRYCPSAPHCRFGDLARFLSPYDLNPLNINPLKDLIARFVDFDALKNSELQLFIAATNVHTGRLRVFPRQHITADAVMASAALDRLLHRSTVINIRGESYRLKEKRQVRSALARQEAVRLIQRRAESG